MASTHKSLRSSTADKRPTTAIADGQIALNTNAASPGLFFKDSTGATIIKVGPVHVGTTAPNATPASGGSTGNSTGEIWLDTSLTPVGVKIWNGASWTNATPIGSTTVQGLLELATDAETQTGVDTARAVTPAGLQSKVSDSISTTSSTTIASSTAVKTAYDLANAALSRGGGTITGNLEIGTTGSLSFEGSTADGFETTIAVVDPTADRTITLPNVSGTVVTTGDTGSVTSTMIADGTIVNQDVNASAAIAGTKISPDFGAQNVTTTGTSTAASFIPTSSTVPTNGVYLPAANSVGISTNGTGRLFIDANGCVGLGIAPDNQAYRLQIYNSSQDSAYISIGNTTAGSGALNGLVIGQNQNDSLFLNRENGSVQFYTNNSERLRITAAGLVGVGTSVPATLLDLSSTTTAKLNLTYPGFGIATLASDSTGSLLLQADEANTQANSLIQFKVDGTERARLTPTGLGIGTTPASQLHVSGSASGTTITQIIENTNAGGYVAQNFRVGSAGGSGDAQIFYAPGSVFRIGPIANDTTAPIVFVNNNNTERARLTSSGQLLVGTSSARTQYGVTAQTQVEGTSNDTASISIISNASSGGGANLLLGRSKGGSIGSNTTVANGDILGSIFFNGANGTNLSNCGASVEAVVDGTVSGGGAGDLPTRLVFSTTADGVSSPTERMRITNGGFVNIGTQGTDIIWNQSSIAGVTIGTAGVVQIARSADTGLFVNRTTNDGKLAVFTQDGVEEGNISVSGTTVSYNGAHLSRWSQIPGIEPHDKTDRPEILRGTVMSNLDEMCDWIDPESGETQDNEQLNKTKISDVEGDKNVAGIFQSWDDDDDTWVNDYYLAMTGDFVIRIAAGVSVERGDLLMSAGDGTAKPQADDLVRSCTIAKVTSTTVSCTHPDGSYCVPCVLMAC
jgi:hypothetical protein